MRSSGGGGASFTAKRRAYGPGGSAAARWAARWCSPQGAGFLVVIAGVWVTVLLIFGTAVFVDKKVGGGSNGGGGSGWSFLSSSSSGSHERRVEASKLRALEEEVHGLSRRVDALAAGQARPPLDLPPEAEATTTEKGVLGRKGGSNGGKGKEGAAGKGAKGPREGKFNSGTSPKPLVDPTVLTRSKPKFEHDDMEGLCRHKNDGDEDILDRVSVWDGAEMGKPRIMCISFTLKKYHDTAVQNVRRTWGQKCDGYIAMSDFTDPDLPSVDIKHDGPEAYENMWQVGGWVGGEGLGVFGCLSTWGSVDGPLCTAAMVLPFMHTHNPTHIHTHKNARRKSGPSGCTSTSTTSTTSTTSSRGCVHASVR